MQQKNNSIISDGGSVKYMDGVFYANDWTEVFVPLLNIEFRRFMELVERDEREYGRCLTTAELVELASEVATDKQLQ